LQTDYGNENRLIVSLGSNREGLGMSRKIASNFGDFKTEPQIDDQYCDVRILLRPELWG
jgi:hypothetical protein